MKLAMACKAMTPRSSVAQAPRRQQALSAAPIRRQQRLQPCRALEIDWSDPDTQIAALGAVVGLVLGIGVPAFYVSRDERDEARLEELRALNRATKEATGEYMTKDEIAAIRPPRWTDGKEFVDDD